MTNAETEQFKADRVQWNYVESQEIRGDRMRGEPIRAGIRSAHVQCKCGYDWVTTEGRGRGQFRPVIGAVRVTCPSCGAEGPIHPAR